MNRKLTEAQVLASALKDIINAAENGSPYSFEELTGAQFRDAVEAISTVEERDGPVM